MKKEKELKFDEYKKLEEIKHKNHMKELEFIRETERMKHLWNKESQRIRSAEIRRNIERKTQRSLE